MSVSREDPVRSYLDRLDRLTADLPLGERAELVASIEEHLDEARSRGELPAAFARIGAPEDVARAARGDSPSAPSSASGSWMMWAALVPLAATIAGFTLLGAVLSITARFDEDADWNVHPLLVLLATGGGVIVGLLVTVVVVVHRGWRVPEKIALVGLWLGALVLAFAGSEIALALPAGAGFAIAAVQLLLGGIGVLTAVALALRAARRGRVSHPA
jgi:hypothetical protein